MSTEPSAHPKELCREIIVAGEQISNLHIWQERQNGDIKQICKRIDQLFIVALAALCSTLGAIAVMVLRIHIP